MPMEVYYAHAPLSAKLSSHLQFKDINLFNNVIPSAILHTKKVQEVQKMIGFN